MASQEEQNLCLIQRLQMSDQKNIPGRIYCIHALSFYPFRLRIASQMANLLEKVDFTEEEVSNMKKELEKYEIQMPSFSKFGGILVNELSVDETALHAAVIAINEAIKKGIAEGTLVTLKNPKAILTSVNDNLAENYQKELWQAKQSKEESAKVKEREAYEELLTQVEIQGIINKINSSVHVAVIAINEAIKKGIAEGTLVTLKNPKAILTSVDDSLAENYQKELWEAKQRKEEKSIHLSEKEREAYEERLTQVEIQGIINKINRLVAIDQINAVIQEGDPSNTMTALMKPEAQLPTVHPFAAVMYQDELFKLQNQNSLDYIPYEELFMTVEILSAVALLNQALETEDLVLTQDRLRNLSIDLNNVDEEYLEWYASRFMSIKREASSRGQDKLGWNEIQNHIDVINVEIREEKARSVHAAVIAINEAIKKGISEQTLITLKNPKAVLNSVNDSLAENYQKELWEAKQRKEEIENEKTISSKEERDVFEELLTQVEIQRIINKVNWLVVINEINAVIREGHPSNTVMALMKPEAQLPTVHPFAAVLYQEELFNLQKQSSLNYLAPEELSTTVEKVSAVALLNQALETEDLELTQDRLRNPSIDFNNLDEAHLERFSACCSHCN
ncbi:ras GTPase-activating-like protein IQGAP1 isoform X2 [Monodelphis domestica]|uniref:ras GTPase-activating-like protein IQGAP1 isoform X2 n=1 Tax=Monodelphis domestica TaxID=13616 RepID=UPI0024E1CA9A|nr:ras GTPase-activating-like protein IQGAP1 isoform X2 [Monodelphis domestica]